MLKIKLKIIQNYNISVKKNILTKLFFKSKIFLGIRAYTLEKFWVYARIPAYTLNPITEVDAILTRNLAIMIRGISNRGLHGRFDHRWDNIRSTEARWLLFDQRLRSFRNFFNFSLISANFHEN